MKFKCDGRINDGLAESPPVVIEVDDLAELFDRLLSGDYLTNDYGEPYGPGATLTVERLA